jgi:hypothetical protein
MLIVEGDSESPVGIPENNNLTNLSFGREGKPRSRVERRVVPIYMYPI